MAKKIKRKRKPDVVRVQISVRIKTPKGKHVSKRLVQDLIQRWADTGIEPKGIEIAAVRWANPTRKRGGKNLGRGWRDGNKEEARRTLHLGRLLQRTNLEIRTIR